MDQEREFAAMFGDGRMAKRENLGKARMHGEEAKRTSVMRNEKELSRDSVLKAGRGKSKRGR